MKTRGEGNGELNGEEESEQREKERVGEKKTEDKKKNKRVRQAKSTEIPNMQLSSARNVAMSTSGGTFNTELKLAEMALLLL